MDVVGAVGAAAGEAAAAVAGAAVAATGGDGAPPQADSDKAMSAKATHRRTRIPSGIVYTSPEAWPLAWSGELPDAG
jgi:hypothetical protein